MALDRFSFIDCILVLDLIESFSLHHVDSVVVGRDPPREQILLAVVLSGLTLPLLRALVNNFDNFVYKNDNFVL